MRGYVICKYCKGVGKTHKWFIFPKKCPHCNGTGFIWIDNIDKYYKKLDII